MVYTKETFSFLETLQAAGADASLANHILTITGCPKMDYRQVAPIQDPSVKLQATVAEVLQVTEVTPVASSPAVGTVYKIQVVQEVQGQIRVVPLEYVVQATTDNATTVCNAWRASLATSSLKDTITGSGSATFIMTAVTGTPVFQVNESQSNISYSTTTPGVYAVGTTAALSAQGIPMASTSNNNNGWTSGHTYTTIVFTFTSDDANRGGDLQKGWNKHTLYVYGSATNYSDFATKMNNIIAAISGGVADPETVAIGS